MPSETPARDWRLLGRYGALVALLLAVPIVPFLLAGAWFEGQVSDWLTTRLPPAQAAGLVFSALAVDVLLPIPSSLLSTWAGARLGPLTATLTVWLGMLAGATFGYGLGRWGGQALVTRWIPPDDLARLQRLVERQGWWMLIVTRPLPVLAEAAVLLVGALRLPARSFLWGVAPTSLAIAVAYALLGYYAREQQWMTLALVLSVAGPLAATWLARRVWTSGRGRQFAG